MAAASDVVWALDLGNSSLKALQLLVVGDVVQVIGFDHIRHGKILSGSGIGQAERDELIAMTLRQFVQQNDIDIEPIIVSVPSQNSFARFVTLPPVEQKRIPEIVKFEASQQIPFDINEVQWDWQMMSGQDDPEKRVGIFAIKNEIVTAAMEHFEREDLQVGFVQMAPMALYNYLVYDRPDLVNSDSRATVIINVGADCTDLVVCTASNVWQRCILMGGNSFTQAIAETFKLNFEKAEKLKRTAPVSKYARQIFQAMRPIFTDMASEIQRSLGFYTSSNPNVKITRIIGMGGGTRLRGLLKYIQQTLQIPVERPDSFKKAAIAQNISAAKLHENIPEFGIVYGLALQGVGLARIESNLLPSSVARSLAWANKTKYFIVAACMLLVASLMALGRAGLDNITYAQTNKTRSDTHKIVNLAEDTKSQLDEIDNQIEEHKVTALQEFNKFKYREILPVLNELLFSVLPNAKNNPDQAELYEAYAKGDVETVMKYKRPDRKQLFITSMAVFFSDDLDRERFGSTAMVRKGEIGNITTQAEENFYTEMESSLYVYDDAYAEGVEETEPNAGFVITIAGYSPYKNIAELIEPLESDDPDKWGVITRLMHPEDYFDSNSLFTIFEKSKTQHFNTKGDLVDLNIEEMPAGIGIVDTLDKQLIKSTNLNQFKSQLGEMINSNGDLIVLRDPVTNEIISTVPEFDQNGRLKVDISNQVVLQKNDRWFVINLKLKWSRAPEMKYPEAGRGRY